MVARIAITQRVIENQHYPERRDALSHDWLQYIARLLPDATLLPVPNQPQGATAWFDAIKPDALILSNGNDWQQSPERDDTEKQLLARARRQGLPTLGVCRGLHVINILSGGQLEPDIVAATGANHIAREHGVKLITPAFKTLATTDSLTVNSYHAQGVLQQGLAPDLTAFALSEDGIIEGLHHKHEAILAIQWHPERAGTTSKFDADIITRLLTQGAFWA